MIMNYGWIGAEFEDKELLESLGVILGDYDPQNKEFVNCQVSDEVLEKLDPYWHRFYWGLTEGK